MMDALIRWSLDNRVPVLVAAVVLLVWGWVQTTRMPVDVFPDLTSPTVTVLVEANGMTPDELERLAVAPLESAFLGATSVRRVRSASLVGFGIVWVEFEWNTDTAFARQTALERIQLVAPGLPDEIDMPVIAPASSIMGEVMFIGATSESLSQRDLRTLVDRDVRRRLLTVPGVSVVVPIGGEVREFQIILRPADLFTHGVTPAQVIEGLQAANTNASLGFVRQNGQEFLLHGVGRITQLSDMEQAVIATHSGVPVRVLDVADVRVGSRVQRGLASINGQSGVILGIQKQPGSNTLALTAALDAELDRISATLPPEVQLHRDLMRQADFIETGVENVSHALRDGAILVIIIVGIFLFSVRATLITALAIPLSLVVAVLLLQWAGISLNTMSMGGMAIAVGALVDDAIIDVENVARRLRGHIATGGQVSVLSVVYDASREVRGSVVFATFIIVLVFVPIFFLEGVEGRLLTPLGIAYVVSLAASLLVALTVTPVLCALFLPTSRSVRSEREPWPVRFLRASYEPILKWSLRYPFSLLAIALLGFVLAVLQVSQSGRAFLPAFNEGAFTIAATTLPGTSLEESALLASRVEHILLEQPEVASVARRTGRGELDEHTQGVHATEMEVRLRSSDGDTAELVERLRSEFSQVSGVAVVIGQPISHRIDHMLSGTRASIAVKIFGSDLTELRRLAVQVQTSMAAVPGVVDLANDDQADVPFLTVDFDRESLARYGLDVRSVSDSLVAALYGANAGVVYEDGLTIPMTVRFPELFRNDASLLGQMLLPTPEGFHVPLSSIATLVRDARPHQISRENGQRKMVMTCNVAAGYALGDVANAVRATLEERVEFPPGYRMELGGQFEAAEATSRRLFWLGLAVLAGMTMLLYMALHSVRDTGLVLLNLPLALIGGVAGVWWMGNVLSVASMIGFMTLFGIATRNGIMLVSHVRHLIEHEGVRDAAEAVRRGASERLAPILMTAMASGLGLVPLVLAAGRPGSEIQAPMAAVVLAGLTTSTILNMLVVPAALLRLGSPRRLVEAMLTCDRAGLQARP
jgi:CzcA family heavy metal efflux pump